MAESSDPTFYRSPGEAIAAPPVFAAIGNYCCCCEAP